MEFDSSANPNGARHITICSDMTPTVRRLSISDVVIAKMVKLKCQFLRRGSCGLREQAALMGALFDILIQSARQRSVSADHHLLEITGNGPSQEEDFTNRDVEAAHPFILIQYTASPIDRSTRQATASRHNSTRMSAF